ncbi:MULTISPECIES: alpha/beta hydrolase [Pseudonocardia]|uniref:Peptidase S33 tripeptidyl aminopeptidase-like C-terminal domain-containing protein n=2 Tax=Pseudonocardia TaxID=1847 RepID=A0A1Y2MJ02_PSEAH|nr:MULTISPECIES: alpha/beta hydrolase [Pseudonocardia]OSY35220.1 hypothetical protein BG845_06194 [Pseudonocardia autotrophica]BBG03903.1 hypothetical protein Pdca_51120 [Pseudonocardia autotrophica]GEC28278.1 hypothetical protein PSA01_53070 [Pseudonocardia saturnea]
MLMLKSGSVEVPLDYGAPEGSTCVDDAVNAYLRDLETPPADARCSL